MKVIIKKKFSKNDLEIGLGDGCKCVTPESFSTIKKWNGVQVSGLEYYVNKAVLMGATSINKQPVKPIIDTTINPAQ